MRRTTHVILAFLAAALLALIGLNGCGSSSSGSNNNVNLAEIIRANSVVMSTVADVTDNDVFDMLNRPAFTNLLGSFGIPELLRSPSNPRLALQAARVIRSHRASKPNDDICSLLTGTFRVQQDTLKYSSPVPTTYLRIIMPNQTVSTDSDSITVSGMTCAPVRVSADSVITLPVAMTLRFYNQHPTTAGLSPGLIGTLTYTIHTGALQVLTGVTVTLDLPSVLATTITFTLDSVNHVYSLGLNINARREGVQESVLLAIHTDGDLIGDSQNTHLTEVDFAGSHSYQGNTWANNLTLDSLTLETSSLNANSARVRGNIRKNNNLVATIYGVLGQFDTSDTTCPAIYVHVTATGETGTVCQVYGQLGLPTNAVRMRTLVADLNPRLGYSVRRR
ncbi:MAG TPA: hypothetical protein VMS93_05585 [Candidatus Saccharimonadales bacterium]|nr:hypothetical protein [Candidatus Saccharimonadales bacterium]